MKKMILGLLLLSTMAYANSNVVCAESVIENKFVDKTMTRTGVEFYLNIIVCVHSEQSINTYDVIKIRERLFSNIITLNDKGYNLASKRAHKTLLYFPNYRSNFRLESISIK